MNTHDEDETDLYDSINDDNLSLKTQFSGEEKRNSNDVNKQSAGGSDEDEVSQGGSDEDEVSEIKNLFDDSDDEVSVDLSVMEKNVQKKLEKKFRHRWALVTKALQEMKGQYDQLKKEMQEMKKENEQLKKRVAVLESKNKQSSSPTATGKGKTGPPAAKKQTAKKAAATAVGGQTKVAHARHARHSSRLDV